MSPFQLKSSKDAKVQETPKEKFVRLATLRTNNVLHSLKVLGNCSNRSVYEYSEEEINKIFSAIDDQLKAVKARFRVITRRNKFKL